MFIRADRHLSFLRQLKSRRPLRRSPAGSLALLAAFTLAAASLWFARQRHVGTAWVAGLLRSRAETPLLTRRALEDGTATADEVAALRQEADNGNAEAQAYLGAVLAGGYGVPANLPAAMQYLQMASEQGQNEAQYALGMLLLKAASDKNGEIEVQVQQQQWAIHWLNQAAAAGEPRAMYQVGSLFSTGSGVDQDLVKAAEWVSASANAGYPEAQYQMGTMLLSGSGVEKNPQWAAYWFEKAAEQGSPDAQYNLALMYEAGDGGLEESKEKAIFWLQKAAAQGDQDSQQVLAEMTR